MPRRRSLSAPKIATAALSVLDREGLDALSMRSTASELGMSPMSLYRYVENREEVERLVVEAVMSSVNLEVPEDPPWTKRVTILLNRVREAVAAHHAAVPLFMIHRHSAVASLRWIESMLSVLNAAGFEGSDQVIAQRTLVHYLVGAIHSEHHGPISGAGTTRMAELPTEDYPNLARAAQRARHIDAEDEFHRGLAVVLDGLQVLLDKRTETPV